MRVIRSTYRGAAEWLAQRRALQEARAAGSAAAETVGLPGLPGLPALEPAVVVSGSGEHAAGAGVLVEAVGPDGAVLYRRLLPEEGAANGAGARREDVIEAAIQEAWRQLVRQVGPPEGEPAP
jgi:hypothetical protein